jgi:hypothetical protein
MNNNAGFYWINIISKSNNSSIFYLSYSVTYNLIFIFIVSYFYLQAVITFHLPSKVLKERINKLTNSYSLFYLFYKLISKGH